MKIGIISSGVPFVQGGYRFIVDWLREKLVERGHAAEIVYIPYTDELDLILPQMAAFRLIKLDDYFERDHPAAAGAYGPASAQGGVVYTSPTDVVRFVGNPVLPGAGWCVGTGAACRDHRR